MNKKQLIIISLSLVLVLTIVFLDRDEEFTGFDSTEEAADSEAWADYFPNEYEGWKGTEEMVINPDETTYGGAGRYDEDGEVVKMDYLEMYPFLEVAYAGFPFSESYYRSRGHAYALEDVLETGRLPDLDERPGACLSCKSTDVVTGIEEHGDDFYSMPFSEVVGENTIGCLDCHDHEDASVKVQRDYVEEGLAHGSFERLDPESDDLTCAQCHINYHFDPEDAKVTPPWSEGMTVEAQLAHYDETERVNDEWEHEITGALVGKVQHPEYETYYEGLESNPHQEMGLSCVDCHMPEQESEEGEEYDSHLWTSPLTHVEDSCMDCHSNWGEEGVVERAEAVQSEVYEKQNRLGEELAEFIEAVGEAREEDDLTDEELEEIQEIHREAQFYWDYVWVENSNGFHNWPEANRILDNAEELINEGMELVQN